MTNPTPYGQEPEALRSHFEALTSDPSFKLRRSRRGTYVNPAVARDWKWFQLGASQAQQPAPATQQPCSTCAALARTVMLDQTSFDRKPDCYGIRQITDDEGVEEWEDIRTSPDVAREEAHDMMVTGRGEIYEVVPLWTTPKPSPASQGDALDAVETKRYADGTTATGIGPLPKHSPSVQHALRALIDVESMLGGANGPTIQIRAVLESLAAQEGKSHDN